MHIHPSSPNSSQSEESAAVRIQAGFRGYRVRKQLKQRSPGNSSSSSTVGTSSNHNNFLRRGYQLFKRSANQHPIMMKTDNSNSTTNMKSSSKFNHSTDEMKLSEDPSDQNEDKCAAKIQAGVRGYLVRKRQKIASDAATKIQASFRGFKARKEVQKLRQK